MKNWTIRWRIVVSFGLVFALLVVMAGVAYTSLRRIERETIAAQTDWAPGLVQAVDLRKNLSIDFILMRDYELQLDAAGRRSIEAQIQTTAARLQAALTNYQATIFNPADQRLFDDFKRLAETYNRVKAEVLATDVGTVRQVDAAPLRAQLRSAFTTARDGIDTIISLNASATEASLNRIRAAVSTGRAGMFATLALVLVVACVCGVLLLRAITHPLAVLSEVVEVMRNGDFTRRIKLARQDEFGALANSFNRMTDELTTLVAQVQRSGLQVNTSVTEIATTAKQQQATANEIAATTTEIGATSREISATSKDLVRTMNEVSAVAEQSAALAGGGQIGLTQMELTIRQVMEAAGSVNAKFATLNEKAADISQVVTTITKVADQTNLLSLNAAIEAEKAGDYGRGFSVVATEVRRLADRTAAATFDIDQMIKGIQSAVSAGVMSMDKFSEEVRRGMQSVQEVGGQLSQVIQQVQALAPRFEAVTEGMQSQAIGAEQITEALSQLGDAARQTVESLRQSSMAIDELNQVSLGLRSGVSRFTVQAA
jgi:methyl-accepting chemotaxis protein WspA